MSKFKTIFFLGTVLIALSLNAVAQDEPVIFLENSSTTSQSAVLASFLSSIDDGSAASSGISVSNILGTPLGTGFPSGGNESGPLDMYLYNNIGTVYRFHTSDFPDVGSGLDSEGNLSPGATYTVSLHEILAALFPDRVPEDRDFVGYAWIVGGFDSISGTYFNSFPLAGASQSFQMEPFGGLPVDVPKEQ